jgi:hypothetical protein
MSEMKVTVTLPLEAGRRFRAMCHAKGLTASEMLAQWISERDDKGDLAGWRESLNKVTDMLKGKR